MGLASPLLATASIHSTYAPFSDSATAVGQVSAGSFGGPQVPSECEGMTFAEVIVGTEGDDVIAGGAGNNLIFGLGGNDNLAGGNASDCIVGGPGDDTIAGNNGADVLLGGDNNDGLSGGNGSDYLDGGAGTDLCDGGNSNNTLVNCESETASASWYPGGAAGLSNN